MNRIGALLVLGVLLAVTGCGAKPQGHASPSIVTNKQRTFEPSQFITCLDRLSLPHGTIHRGEFTKPLSGFPTLVAAILIIGSPSASDPGAKAVMDTVQLFFFKTPRDAEAAQAALAQYYVYLKAPFAYLRGLHLRRVPPTKAAAEATERVDGNVDVFWQYPRIHPKASDKTLNKCLN